MTKVFIPRHQSGRILLLIAGTLVFGSIQRPCLGQSPLKMVPQDASIAFAFAPVKTVDKKLNKIVTEANEQYLGLASIGYSMLSSFFSLPNVADPTKPFALMIPNAKKIGVDVETVVNTGLDQYIGGVFYHKGLDQLAKVTKTSVDDLLDGKARYNSWFLEADKEQVRITKKQDHLQYLRGKSFYDSLDEEAAKRMTADVHLMISKELFQLMWKDMLADIKRQVGESDFQAAERLSDLESMSNQILYSHFGLKLEGGFRLTWNVQFEDRPFVRRFLTRIAGEGAKTLKGLPEGNLAWAFAARSNGSQNASLASLALRMIMLIFRPQDQSDRLNRPLATFRSVWESVEGVRWGIYANKNDDNGPATALGILDFENDETIAKQRKGIVQTLNELLGDDPKEQPAVTIAAKSRLIKGQAVETLRLRPTALLPAERKELATLFGDKWNILKFTQVDSRVLFLVGGDESLLEKSISALKDKKGQLGGSAAFKSAKVDPRAQAAFWVSVQNVASLSQHYYPVNKKYQVEPMTPKVLSSSHILFQDARFEVSAFLPSKEFGTMMQLGR